MLYTSILPQARPYPNPSSVRPGGALIRAHLIKKGDHPGVLEEGVVLAANYPPPGRQWRRRAPVPSHLTPVVITPGTLLP